MKPSRCDHRHLFQIAPTRFAWPDGELLNPPIRTARCSACGKRWGIGLSRGQRTRLLRHRPRGDKRSPYEFAPDFLEEMP